MRLRAIVWKPCATRADRLAAAQVLALRGAMTVNHAGVRWVVWWPVGCSR